MIRRAALVSAFAALLVLPPLGQRFIVTGDEARFALLAQDMLTRGTWFDARVRDRRDPNEPPLYPWLIKVLSMPPGRVSETTAQLPVALAAVAAVVLTTLLGQQLASARAGMIAGLVTATSYGFFAHSQLRLSDMLVVSCGLAALAAFWASVSDPPHPRALPAFYVALALGVAAGGPMGLLPLLVVVVWLQTGKGVLGLGHLVSRGGVLAFLAVTAVWLVPSLSAGGHSLAWEDWAPWHRGGPRPLTMLNLLLDVARGLTPWTALLVLPLLPVRRQWRGAPYRFVFLAWLVPLVVVLLAHDHRAGSLLATCPAAGLLLAWWSEHRDPESSRTATIVAGFVAVGGLVALAGLALPWLDPVERDLVEHFWWKAGPIAAGGLALTGYACWALLTRRPRALVVGVALAMAALLAGGVRVYNQWVNRSQDYPGLAALIERYAQGGEVGIAGGRFFSIDFYLGRALTPVQTVAAFDAWVSRADQPMVVITGREWSLYRTQVRSEIELLDAMRIHEHLVFLVRQSEPLPRPGHPRRDPASRPPLL